MSLSVGDKVPSFDSTDQNGNSFNLDKFKDQKIVLYFYPRDNTSGCTAPVSYTHLTLPTTVFV